MAFKPQRPHLSLWPEETICGFDHVWFSSASSFPFLVNPSHLDKVGFLQHKLHSVIPCSETFQDSLMLSEESKHLSIVFKALHYQNSTFLSGTFSPCASPHLSIPDPPLNIFFNTPGILVSSYSWDQEYSFTR